LVMTGKQDRWLRGSIGDGAKLDLPFDPLA
jgi:hypothetical protein